MKKTERYALVCILHSSFYLLHSKNRSLLTSSSTISSSRQVPSQVHRVKTAAWTRLLREMARHKSGAPQPFEAFRRRTRLTIQNAAHDMTEVGVPGQQHPHAP